MNGYATLTADEHEMEAEFWASMADTIRKGHTSYSDIVSPGTFELFSCLMMVVRAYQNFAVMHMEDAQRMRSYGRK